MLPLKMSRYLLPIRPWFFFESPCLGLCLWCCISVPGRCRFQCSRNECYLYILVCRFPSSPLSSTCSSSDSDFSLSSGTSSSVCYSLVCCGILVHMSMPLAKWRWPRHSPSIFKHLVSQVSRRNMFECCCKQYISGVILSWCNYFLFPFLNIITTLAFFHAMGIHLSDKDLVYSLASVFEMVSSPPVSMFIWSLPVDVPFFIVRSAASTNRDAVFGTYYRSMWFVVLCSLSYSSV